MALYKENYFQRFQMNVIKNMLGRVFALWAMLLFVVTMVIFLVPFLLFAYPVKEPFRTIRFINFSRVWMGIYLTLIGCPLRIRGKEHFKKGKP